MKRSMKKSVKHTVKRNVKYSMKKSYKYSHKSRSRQHIYYINTCNFDDKLWLDNTILASYLDELGLRPDRIQYELPLLDKEKCKKKGITYEEFCKFHKDVSPVPIKEPKNVRADVFFYLLSNKILDQRLYNFKKFLVNTLQINFNNTTFKDMLYYNVWKISHSLADKYFIKTFPINHYDEYVFPGFYVLRPSDSSSGIGIIYVSSRKELDDAVTFYNTNKNYRGILYGNNVSASLYIQDLLLFKGIKCHLRMYFMISCIKNTISYFLLDDCKILTAKYPFDLDPPYIKEKHDTHAKSTLEDYLFSSDFTTENMGITVDKAVTTTIYNNCKKLCSILGKMIVSETIGYGKNSRILYPDQKNGYRIFGLDVFIKKDLEPVLIECNASPIFSFIKKEGRIKLSKIMYKWINEVILEPLFKYNDPNIAKNHHTYIDSY
jgi:hypothetical protein